ncbi:MAG TPA: hypothetical protein RMH99_02165 [Sandaracinaceae bacterium LLY-WYZ-13_1]|nr:hypothetical protein [Sandaracinaceae bacterium LLY-WYZ-13_1]
MGIEKPYVFERHDLGAPPGRPRPVDVEARVRDLVQPASEGVAVAGHPLRVPFDLRHEAAADDLRALITTRFRERRPNADDTTWEHFATQVEGLARHAAMADNELKHAITLTIDAL